MRIRRYVLALAVPWVALALPAAASAAELDVTDVVAPTSGVDATAPVEDAVQKTTGTATGTLDGTTDGVRKTVDEPVRRVKEVADDPVGAVNKIVDGVVDRVDETTRPVTDDVHTIVDPLPDPTRGKTADPSRTQRPRRDAGGDGDARRRTAATSAGAARVADHAARRGRPVPAPAAVAAVSAEQLPEPRPVAEHVAAGPSVADVAENIVDASRAFSFPLAVGVLVVLFLAIQGRMDAHDPKLAAGDDEELTFA